MSSITHQSALVIALLAAHVSGAQAGTALSAVFFKGSDGTAAGSLQTTVHLSGEQLVNLSYDFRQGGAEAAARLALDRAYAGTHVRLRVRAPATAQLALRVQAPTPNDPLRQLTYPIDRRSARADASGWETQTIQVSTGSALAITAAALVVAAPPAAASDDKVGVASLRGVELWPSAPPLGSEPGTDTHVRVTGATAATSVNPVSAVSTDGYHRGDDFQRVSYNFSGPAQYAGVLFTPAGPMAPTYARFRIWAPARAPLKLHVQRTAGTSVIHTLNRRDAVDDGSGWLSFVVPLGNATANLQSLALFTQKDGTAPVTGRLYVKEMDLLDHAPLAHEPLPPLTAAHFASTALAPSQGAGTMEAAISGTPAAGGTVNLHFNFAGAGANASAGVALTLQNPVTANRLRFLARLPLAAPLSVVHEDTLGNTVTTKVFKPLGLANDTGWVPYAIKLAPLPGPVRKVVLRLDRSTTNSNVTSYSIFEKNAQPSGTAHFKQVTVGNEPEQLDLAPTSAGLPGMTERGFASWSIMGVNSHDAVGDLPRVQELGLPMVRIGQSWQSAEPTIAQGLNTSPLVSAVNKYLAAGIRPIVLLAYNNRNYATAPDGSDHAKIGLADDAARAGFVEYARAASGAFANQPLVSFEVWNEPNLYNTFWLPVPTESAVASGQPAQEYAKLLNATANALGGANRPVVSGGLANIHFPYLKALSRTTVFLQVSRVGLHPYTDGVPEVSGEGNAAALAMIQANAAALGMALPVAPKVWTTEVGHSSNRLGAPFPSDEVVNGVLQKRSREPANLNRQAVLIARQMLTSAASGSQAHIVFRIRDQYSCESYNSNESNYGLYSVAYNTPCPATTAAAKLGTWTEKPAARAVKTLRKAMNGRSYQGMVTASPSSVQAMKLEGAGMESVYAVWANGRGSQGRVTFVPSCDPGRELDGTAGAANASCVRDLQNNPITCPATTNGRLACTVTEDAGPIFVRTRRAE